MLEARGINGGKPIGGLFRRKPFFSEVVSLNLHSYRNWFSFCACFELLLIFQKTNFLNWCLYGRRKKICAYSMGGVLVQKKIIERDASVCANLTEEPPNHFYFIFKDLTLNN